MLRGERKVSFAVRKPTPVKKVSPLQTSPVKKVAKFSPPVKEIRRVKRAVEPIVRPVKVAPVVKPPSAIERIAKIVPVKKFTPVAAPRKTISTTPKREVNRKAVITPIAPQVKPIAIEKERQEIIKAVAPKNRALREVKGVFEKKFKPISPVVMMRKIDMKAPLGIVAPVPNRNVSTKKIGRILPKTLRKMGLEGTFVSKPPKKMVAKPVFRKSPVDVVKDVEKKPIVVTPATKNFLSALLPGLALFFLKK